MTAARTVALIGPGRAGTTIALGLAELGWDVVAVAGRAPDAASTRTAALGLDARAALVSDAATGAGLVVVAVPDRAIEATLAAIAPTVEPEALVVHLAGAHGLEVFEALGAARPDVRTGALHPLQTFPTTAAGLERLRGSWAAVAGDPAVEQLARELGLRPFPVADADRATYHAAAVVASNHLVALLGQVERLAAGSGAPFEAFAPLVRSSTENAFLLGAAEALTGPVARGDLGTVERHLGALDPTERDAYRAMAREAARLAGRRDTALERLLDDLHLRRRRPRD
ncbi:MAG: Rossmann-like and DUF2520 domain-containing protein [Actinomycetota bacterium]